MRLPHSASIRILRRPFLRTAAAAAALALVAAAGAQETPETEKKEEEAPASETIIALAAFRSQPGLISPEYLGRLLESTLGLKRAEEPGPGSYTISGEEQVFVVTIDGVHFTVFDFGEPYFLNPEEVASRTKNDGAAELIRRTKAWLSIDLMEGKDDPGRVLSGYRIIGKLQAAMADGHTLALWEPITETMQPWNPRLLPILRSGEPLLVFAGGFLDEKASQEARRDWPEFLAAWGNRTGRERFFVRVIDPEAPDKETRWCELVLPAPSRFEVAEVKAPVNWDAPERLATNAFVFPGEIIDWRIGRPSAEPAEPEPSAESGNPEDRR